MALTKAKKKEILDDLKHITEENKSLVFVNFHGLPVSETSLMRKSLRKEDVGYFVTKKTLIKKAFEGSKYKGDLPELSGEVAIAYGKDETAPAREIYSFQKKYKDSIKILGGIFEGKYLNLEEMTEIASIPSMFTLRGPFVNVINSPIQGMVIALDALAKRVS